MIRNYYNEIPLPTLKTKREKNHQYLSIFLLYLPDFGYEKIISRIRLMVHNIYFDFPSER